MSAVTETHEEKETLIVDVDLPGHAPRTATPLFESTRKQLIARAGGRCWICGATEAESGLPLEAHHFPVERSLATAWDWPVFIRDCQAGVWGAQAQAFDWTAFDPADPYLFVDDQPVQLWPCFAHGH